jgi:ATP-dependent Clp protease adaptor protein ClpS
MVLEKTHKVTLLNDDVNSYEYVMACLIRFCQHDPIQAEQCATLTDKVGKCDVKLGNMDNMFELVENLKEMGLKAELSVYESNLH